MIDKFILALVLLNICHWTCDFTQLCTIDMLRAKKFGEPLHPIFMHALRHAVCMMVVCLFFNPYSIGMVLWIELFSHFALDVLKGRMNKWYPYLQNPANVYHWWVFGADQFLHQMILIILAYIVIH